MNRLHQINPKNYNVAVSEKNKKSQNKPKTSTQIHCFLQKTLFDGATAN